VYMCSMCSCVDRCVCSCTFVRLWCVCICVLCVRVWIDVCVYLRMWVYICVCVCGRGLCVYRVFFSSLTDNRLPDAALILLHTRNLEGLNGR